MKDYPFDREYSVEPWLNHGHTPYHRHEPPTSLTLRVSGSNIVFHELSASDRNDLTLAKLTAGRMQHVLYEGGAIEIKPFDTWHTLNACVKPKGSGRDTPGNFVKILVRSYDHGAGVQDTTLSASSAFPWLPAMDVQCQTASGSTVVLPLTKGTPISVPSGTTAVQLVPRDSSYPESVSFIGPTAPFDIQTSDGAVSRSMAVGPAQPQQECRVPLEALLQGPVRLQLSAGGATTVSSGGAQAPELDVHISHRNGGITQVRVAVAAAVSSSLLASSSHQGVGSNVFSSPSDERNYAIELYDVPTGESAGGSSAHLGSSSPQGSATFHPIASSTPLSASLSAFNFHGAGVSRLLASGSGSVTVSMPCQQAHQLQVVVKTVTGVVCLRQRIRVPAASGNSSPSQPPQLAIRVARDPATGERKLSVSSTPVLPDLRVSCDGGTSWYSASNWVRCPNGPQAAVVVHSVAAALYATLNLDDQQASSMSENWLGPLADLLRQPPADDNLTRQRMAELQAATAEGQRLLSEIRNVFPRRPIVIQFQRTSPTVISGVQCPGYNVALVSSQTPQQRLLIIPGDSVSIAPSGAFISLVALDPATGATVATTTFGDGPNLFDSTGGPKSPNVWQLNLADLNLFHNVSCSNAARIATRGDDGRETDITPGTAMQLSPGSRKTFTAFDNKGQPLSHVEVVAAVRQVVAQADGPDTAFLRQVADVFRVRGDQRAGVLQDVTHLMPSSDSGVAVKAGICRLCSPGVDAGFRLKLSPSTVSSFPKAVIRVLDEQGRVVGQLGGGVAQASVGGNGASQGAAPKEAILDLSGSMSDTVSNSAIPSSMPDRIAAVYRASPDDWQKCVHGWTSLDAGGGTQENAAESWLLKLLCRLATPADLAFHVNLATGSMSEIRGRLNYYNAETLYADASTGGAAGSPGRRGGGPTAYRRVKSADVIQAAEDGKAGSGQVQLNVTDADIGWPRAVCSVSMGGKSGGGGGRVAPFSLSLDYRLANHVSAVGGTSPVATFSCLLNGLSTAAAAWQLKCSVDGIGGPERSAAESHRINQVLDATRTHRINLCACDSSSGDVLWSQDIDVPQLLTAALQVNLDKNTLFVTAPRHGGATTIVVDGTSEQVVQEPIPLSWDVPHTVTLRQYSMDAWSVAQPITATTSRSAGGAMLASSKTGELCLNLPIFLDANELRQLVHLAQVHPLTDPASSGLVMSQIRDVGVKSKSPLTRQLAAVLAERLQNALTFALLQQHVDRVADMIGRQGDIASRRWIEFRLDGAHITST